MVETKSTHLKWVGVVRHLLETRHFGDVRLHAIGITTNNGWQFTIVVQEINFAKGELTVVFKVTIVGVPASFTLEKEAELLLPFEYRTNVN